ncbi:MAG: hypothetical protein EBU90_13470 [Proteobacteria bacterium]|nr:hypothetical protein [Pseudomonadota bacterium]
MTWVYQGQTFDSIPEGYIAFVYKITNLNDGRMYIGKKLFYFTKTKTIKGKKKRILEESDWKEYWSSSEELKTDVKTLGESRFTREVLHLCKNKGTASYIEAREQFANEVLENPEKWYNGYIGCRIHRKHLKL